MEYKYWGEPPKNLPFKGKYVSNWFSNFEQSPFIMSGKLYNTVENYYQATKAVNKEDHERIRIATASKSKYLGRSVQIREGWDKLKFAVMWAGLCAKWTQSPFKERLLATGDEQIIEWNNWGDRIWGVTLDGYGHNHLGLLLMKLREQLKQ